MSRPNTKIVIYLVVIAAVLGLLSSGMLYLTPALAAESTGSGAAPPDALRWGLIAAAISTGASAIGAGYAVALVGSAAIGALAEKPELLGRVLILVGLAEGIAIYGVLMSVLILNRL